MKHNNDIYPEIPKTWLYLPVKDTYTPVTTKTKIKAKEYLAAGVVPVIDQGASFISGYTNIEAAKIDHGSSVIVFGDHTRLVKYIDFPFAAGADGIKVLSPIKAYLPKLYYFFLRSLSLPNKGYARHFKFLRAAQLPLPPLNEQKRIVQKLESLLSRVNTISSKLEAAEATLDKLTAATLAKAFRGELVPQDPNDEPAQKLLERIQKESSGNPQPTTPTTEHEGLPEGWNHITFLDICQSKGQYGYTTKATPIGEIKLLRTTDITSGAIDWSTVPYCAEAPKDIPKYQLVPQDILISRAGSVGFSILIEKPPRNVVFASYLIRFTLSPEIHAQYVAFFLKSSAYWQQISDASAGFVVQNVNAKKLANIDVPLPPLNEQKRIAAALEQMLGQIDTAREKIQEARANVQRLTAALLAKAFCGELVPQDPNDEPADVLLARIQAERKQGEKRKAKRDKFVAQT